MWIDDLIFIRQRGISYFRDYITNRKLPLPILLLLIIFKYLSKNIFTLPIIFVILFFGNLISHAITGVFETRILFFF